MQLGVSATFQQCNLFAEGLRIVRLRCQEDCKVYFLNRQVRQDRQGKKKFA